MQMIRSFEAAAASNWRKLNSVTKYGHLTRLGQASGKQARHLPSLLFGAGSERDFRKGSCCGARTVQLRVGMQVEGHSVIEAVRVNGIDIDRHKRKRDGKK